MSATLYLMRHGIAAEPSPTMQDADRALTAEGVRKTTQVAIGLRAIGVAPDLILSSPLRRAEETARLAAGVLAPTVGVEIFPPLAAGATPAAEIVKALRIARGARHVMLVGHQPDLGELASLLLTGSASLAPLPFRKASVAAIDVGSLPPRAAGLLEWFLTPSQLRAIGSGRA
ncbi:MAG: phosphohistidine phosphatase SixA [Candidatus Binatia bacterium]